MIGRWLVRCLGIFGAVMVFAVMVMLAVAGGCGSRVGTEPGRPGVSPSAVAGECAPFCGVGGDGHGMGVVS